MPRARPAGALSRAERPPEHGLPGSAGPVPGGPNRPGPYGRGTPNGPGGSNGPGGPYGPGGPNTPVGRSGPYGPDTPGGRSGPYGPNGPGGPNGPIRPNGPQSAPTNGAGAPPPGAGDSDDGGPGRHSRRERKGKPPRSLARTIVEWVAVIGGGIVIALIIEAFLIQAFWIPSPSMVPTLNVGDRVLVNKLAYQWGDVHRGDVVVFERPEGIEGEDGIKDLIKRVIAVGGDTIESRNGLVYVNGERVDESDYLEPGTATDDLPPTEVPEGHVFVMGDNRTNSTDSRSFGAIPEDTIVGRAFIKVLPLSDIGWL